MLMMDIRKQNYQVFQGIEDSRKRSTLENAVKYVDRLAAQAQVDISRWPVLEVFHNQTTGHIHTDKIKLNQAFFAWTKQANVSTSRLTAQRKQALNALFDGVREQRWQSLERSRQIKVRDADSYMRSYENLIHDAIKLQAQIMIIKGNDGTYFINEMEQVLEDGWYTVEVIDGDLIRLITPEIVLSYVNQAQKVDIQVPFGSFVVELKVKEARLRCYKHKNNIPEETPDRYGGFHYHGTYFHPHVSHLGQICFGEISGSVTEALSKMELGRIFAATRSVLTTYHPGNPYVHLHTVRDYLNKLTQEKKREEGTATARAARQEIVQV